MSSDTYDASAKLCQSFGTSLAAAELAITADPGAKLIFDHAVALIAELLPKKDTVHEDTAKRIFEAGFGYGAQLSIDSFHERRPPSVENAREQAWHHFRESHDAGTFADPKKPLEFWRPAEPATPPVNKPSDLLPGKEPSVGSLDTWFNQGMKARDDKTNCLYTSGSVAQFMFVKGWVFRDIQILACRFCASYAREQIESGNITQQQIDDYAANGRQK